MITILHIYKAYHSIKDPMDDNHKTWVHVSIKSQTLIYHGARGLKKEYTISTSRNQPSCYENSFGTPWGLHKVIQKIGCNASEGVVFVGRVSTGQHFSEHPENNQKTLITTRILRLQGLEPHLNQGTCDNEFGEPVCCDTFKRYVYIHGTNKEHEIGTPASQGCILMTNKDIIELYDLVELETPVKITLS